MSIISLQSLTLKFGTKTILNQATWHIKAGERIALVGRNGAGKSSLLKLIYGLHEPDSGHLHIQNQIQVASLLQDVSVHDKRLGFEVLTQSLGKQTEAIQAYFHAMRTNEQALMTAAKAQLDEVQGWELPKAIDQIASGLGISLYTSIDQLSGGERRRVFLGAVLLSKADVFLLDEPTNHLDIQTIEWLENYLKPLKQTIILITHDRFFLQNIARKIVLIDRAKLYPFDCDYETYLDRLEAIRIQESTQNALFDKRLKSEEAWLRKGIKARRTRNEGRVRQLKAMRETFRARHTPIANAKLHQLEAKHSGQKVLEIKSLTYTHPKLEDRSLISSFSYTVLKGEKIGIIGPNGCGKSTLIQLILGTLKPSSGSIQWGTSIELVYLSQLREILNESSSVIDNVADGATFVNINGQSRHVASYLKDFLFTDAQFQQPVSVLSGGEKNRLLLAKTLAKPMNVLIMDEPTNDLDIETLQLLESLLLNYTGTLLLISHDRAFINQVVTSLWVFETDGHLSTIVGGYDDYMHHQLNRSLKPSKTSTSKQEVTLKPSSKPKKNNHTIQKEIKKITHQIEKLEQSIQSIHQEMAKTSFYSRPQAEQDEASTQLKALESQRDKAFILWESLEEQLSSNP